jgi:hypothetical protein
MSKFEIFMRKLFGRCIHRWEFKDMIHVNQYDEEEDYSQVVSSKEYSMQKCSECNQVKFRKL